LAIREGFAQTLSQACQSAETPQSSASSEDLTKLKADNVKLQYRIEHLTSAYDQEVSDTSRKEELFKLKAENVKLNYRIVHLTRALDEKL
jgi:hypothetical protein